MRELNHSFRTPPSWLKISSPEVVVGIHKDNIDSVLKTYHLMSQRWFTHASPTLCNARTPRPQLSSCFHVCMIEDSIEEIYDTLKECAVISKSARGIGVSVHSIGATRLRFEGSFYGRNTGS
ncbi:hypothetical protein MKW98_005882 [Papaver atlanticum]|uniref:Ribonucleoside-diphosphate reductase n=1 Tax=Papaver atlanticum TaxID=357466 RepID=A0AAD4TDN8_9MAGN|nr:hypothetical protein MKW98_005882 [Papaver atlanticum]